MKLFKSLVAGMVLSLAASSAWAIESLDPSKLTGDTFESFTKDMGSTLSYKAISPAEPLGLLGFDIGIEITGTSLQGIETWGSAIGDTDLSLLPLPKIHAHKGLPFGIDVGLVYATLPMADISYIGGELRYSFVSGNLALPAVAVRGTYSQLMGVDEVSLSTKGVELTVSKGFLMFTPYGGIGNVWTNGELSVLNTVEEADVSQFKYFVGLNLNLGLMNLVAEMDQTGDAKSYTAKMGFRF